MDVCLLENGRTPMTTTHNTLIRVATARQTCYACPSQWEGHTPEGREVYARYRWGHLSVYVSREPGGNAIRDGEVVFSRDLAGDGMSGVLNSDGLRTATAGVIAWPAAMKDLEDVE